MGKSFSYRILLFVSYFYGLFVMLRNLMFDFGLLPSRSFPLPVICVGNLAVGGTGKTPHVEYIVRMLMKSYRVAVLSRGYGRLSRGFVLAGPGVGSFGLGDEPYQIYRKFPGVTVAVDANRCRGIERLLSLPAGLRPEVIVLDDAFQHRYVRPSLSILLTCYGELFSDDHLLPAGRLREPLGGASRADITVVTKTPYGVGGLGDLFYTSIRYGQLRPLFPEFFVDRETGLERLRDLGVSLLLVTGISDPSYVVEYLRDLGLEFSCMHFPDHHRFTKRDIDDVVDNFDLLAGPDRLLVTTEKDGSRLLDCPYLPDALKPYILELPIGLTFFSADREELFIQKIKNHVEGFKRDGIVVTSAGTG